LPWWIAGANRSPARLGSAEPAALLGIYTIGILASLPVMFVPFHALLEQAPPRAAFAASSSAFALNVLPLLVYAAASLALLGFGLATMGLGLVLVLPLWAASSYAAWKDIFGVRDPPCDARTIATRFAPGVYSVARHGNVARGRSSQRMGPRTRAPGGQRRPCQQLRTCRPCTTASTVPSRRLRTQPAMPSAPAASALAIR
jgi:hypothetical protein